VRAIDRLVGRCLCVSTRVDVPGTESWRPGDGYAMVTDL
jgi:hypothetical protein